jgi:hypothetical protein
MSFFWPFDYNRGNSRHEEIFEIKIDTRRPRRVASTRTGLRLRSFVGHQRSPLAFGGCRGTFEVPNSHSDQVPST